MKHEEGNFHGLNDTNIFYQYWLPDTDPSAVLIIIHGFGEHSGRYMNVVDKLVPAGIVVFALDHRGHGKSGGKSNYVNRFTDYLEDIKTFEGIVIDHYPEAPLFLLGHSMGSLIAAHFMANYANQSRYSAFMLSGTGADYGPGISAVTRFLAKILSFIAPKLSIPSNLDPNFISHDQSVIDAYVNDPLVKYDKITARLGAEMMKNTADMKMTAAKINVPTQIQVGSEDDAFSDEQGLFDSISHQDKQLKVYDGFRHEVFNEVEKEKPLEDLKSWITSHI